MQRRQIDGLIICVENVEKLNFSDLLVGVAEFIA
jgi:hypothetical protein